MKVLVIEDEMIIAEDIRMMLENLGYEVVGVALDYDEAVELLDESTPDIVLSDIALGGAKDGVDLGRLIKDNYDMPFIFVTSHSDKSTLDRAKAVKPNGYLVKPFDANDLYAAIEVALANFSSAVEKVEDSDGNSGYLIKDAVFVKDQNHFIKVAVNDLLWMKSEGNYLELHLSDKRIVIRSSLKDFMDLLSNPKFFRIHKSYAINLDKLVAINSASVSVDESVLPVGRNYRDDLLNKLNTA